MTAIFAGPIHAPVLRKLVGYAAIMFGASTFFGLLSLAVSLLGMITRSKEAYGEYMTYVLVYSSAQGLFIFGANAAIQRYSAATPENRARFAGTALRIFALLLAVTSVLAFAAYQLFNLQIALGVVAIPWVVVWWWGRYLVRSTLDAKREAILAGVVSLSTTGLQLALLSLTGLEHALVYGDFGAIVIGGAVAIFMFRGATGQGLIQIWRSRFEAGIGKEAFRFAVPFWWAGQIGSMSQHVSGFLVRGKLGAQEMGTNGAVQTLWQFAFKPMELLGQATLPGLVGAKEGRKELLFDVLRLCLVLFPAIGLAVAGGMPLLFEALDIASSLLGKANEPFSVKYAAVMPLLTLLSIGVPLIAFGMVIAQYATAAGESRVPFWAQTATTVASLTALYPLTVAYGLTGTFIAGHLGAVAQVVTYVLLMRGRYTDEIATGVKWLAATLVSCTAAAGLIYWAQQFPWGWVAVVPALAIYGAGAFLVGLLRPSDFQRAWRAVMGRRSPAG